MDIKEEAQLGTDIKHHWYYVSKGRALRSLIGDLRVDEVLDVGAGSAEFSRQLIAAGVCARATCVDPAYTDERLAQSDNDVLFVRSIEHSESRLALMMDVLEHVDDDLNLLQHYTQMLPEHARVVISVPAFEMLWSSHDLFFEHRRRYTLRSLERVVRAANLEVIRSRYFFGSLMPIVALSRLLERVPRKNRSIEPKSHLRPYPAIINKTLVAIHDCERVMMFPINKLAGLTVFCVARVTRS